MPRGRGSAVARGLLVVVLVLSVLAGARTARVAYGPAPGAKVLAAQTRFLDAALADGAGAQMQQLFPEGEFFTTALTALAEAGQPAPDVDRLRQRLAVLDSPELTARFGPRLTPEHGIFAAGWTLLLAAEIARLSAQPADLAVLQARADAVASALTSEPTGFPESYPGGRWPCDAVVAAAAVSAADAVRPTAAWRDGLRTWRTAVLRSTDPTTGLLPHRVDDAGRPLEGPRGSSQALIQVFWPDIAQTLDGRADLATWRRYTEAFVVRRAGLIGVREFPRGTRGRPDQDSGPLVLGVSGSASAVTLGAARRVGDVALAADLDREAELLGAGLTIDGRRRYALGVAPVGDAFLAWARSRPPGPGSPAGTPVPLWAALVAAALLPGLLAGAGLVVLRGTRAGSCRRPCRG